MSTDDHGQSGAGELVIFLGLTVVQLVYGAYSVFLSRVLTLGLDPLFLVIAGNFTTFVLISPFAVAFERRRWPRRLNLWLLLQFVLIALGGATAFQALMLLGIAKTSPAIASAMPNLSPGFIFVIAACLRFETVDIRCPYTKAKIVGTLMCLTGAVAMSFLQNPTALPSSKRSSMTGLPPPAAPDGDWILGCTCLVTAAFVVSCAVVLQAVTMKGFPAPLSLCAITSLIGAVLTGAVQVVADGSLSIGSPLVGVGTVVSIVIGGGTATSACVAFQTWCVKKRGPVLVSMFSPVGTVFATILAALTLGQLPRTTSMAGMLVMFVGLYLVLWAKKRETFLLPRESSPADEANEATDVEKPLLS